MCKDMRHCIEDGRSGFVRFRSRSSDSFRASGFQKTASAIEADSLAAPSSPMAPRLRANSGAPLCAKQDARNNLGRRKSARRGGVCGAFRASCIRANATARQLNASNSRARTLSAEIRGKTPSQREILPYVVRNPMATGVLVKNSALLDGNLTVDSGLPIDWCQFADGWPQHGLKQPSASIAALALRPKSG